MFLPSLTVSAGYSRVNPQESTITLPAPFGTQTLSPAIEDNWLSANEIQAFWTVDGENEAALGATNAGGAAGRSLFLSWDGGSTWQPADFSAR